MAYLQARDQVLTQRRLKNNTRFKMIEAQEKKAEEANRVRKECAKLIKQKDKNDKKYVSNAQEKKFEMLILKEALKMKNEQVMVSKIGKEM